MCETHTQLDMEMKTILFVELHTVYSSTFLHEDPTNVLRFSRFVLALLFTSFEVVCG